MCVLKVRQAKRTSVLGYTKYYISDSDLVLRVQGRGCCVHHPHAPDAVPLPPGPSLTVPPFDHHLLSLFCVFSGPG